MTYSELCAKFREILPEIDFQEDLSDQIIIYTGLKVSSQDHETLEPINLDEDDGLDTTEFVLPGDGVAEQPTATPPPNFTTFLGNRHPTSIETCCVKCQHLLVCETGGGGVCCQASIGGLGCDTCLACATFQAKPVSEKHN